MPRGDLDQANASRPTTVRWRIVGLLMGYAALCHFNRISMSVAGSEQIIPHSQIDPTLMGMVYSAYLLAYTLCMTPGGWLIDRWGPWAALVLMGFGSALFVALTGLAGAPWMPVALLVPMLLGVRALAGVVTVPIHPAAARTVSYWIPVRGRAWANGLITGAALLGIASTYTVFGRLMDEVGWPFSTPAGTRAGCWRRW
jgi:MFS family permease